MPRLPSDYGGQSAGPVDQSPYEPTLFDKRVDALRILMGKVDPKMTSDVSRRTQEDLDQETYDNMFKVGHIQHAKARKKEKSCFWSLTNNFIFFFISNDEPK